MVIIQVRTTGKHRKMIELTTAGWIINNNRLIPYQENEEK